jgi:hypothetical protein
MGQDILSATLFTKGAHLDRSELGTGLVRSQVFDSIQPCFSSDVVLGVSLGVSRIN